MALLQEQLALIGWAMTGAAENPDCATVWTVEEDTGDDDCKDVEGKVLPAENHSSKLEISVSILVG